jgi:flavin-dependent dehydrogenase
MANTIKDYVDFEITKLFRNFLFLVQDLAHEHATNFDKLESALPEYASLIRQADYFDEEKIAYLRKRVLDMGNDAIRHLAPALSTMDSEIILKVKGNEKQDNILVARNGQGRGN